MNDLTESPCNKKKIPIWLVPLGIAICLLSTDYSDHVLILTILFCPVGFAVIPLLSRLLGCKNCEIKEDCPWMRMKVSPPRSSWE